MIDITKGTWITFNSKEEYDKWSRSVYNYRNGVLVIKEGFTVPGKYLLIHIYEDRYYTDELLSANEVRELAREEIMKYHQIYKDSK